MVQVHVTKNIKGFVFKKHSYLVCSQNWLNLPMDPRHFWLYHKIEPKKVVGVGGDTAPASVAGAFWRCWALSGAASGTSHLPLSLCSRLPSSSPPSPRQWHARLWRWQKKALGVQRTEEREGQNITSHAGIMTEKEPASFLRWGMSQ